MRKIFIGGSYPSTCWIIHFISESKLGLCVTFKEHQCICVSREYTVRRAGNSFFISSSCTPRQLTIRTRIKTKLSSGNTITHFFCLISLCLTQTETHFVFHSSFSQFLSFWRCLLFQNTSLSPLSHWACSVMAFALPEEGRDSFPPNSSCNIEIWPEHPQADSKCIPWKGRADLLIPLSSREDVLPGLWTDIIVKEKAL